MFSVSICNVKGVKLKWHKIYSSLGLGVYVYVNRSMTNEASKKVFFKNLFKSYAMHFFKIIYEVQFNNY